MSPDPTAAGRSVEQARKHLASARITGVDGESRYLILYQAALKAMASVLTAAGRRVTEGRASHVLYIEQSRRLLGPERTELCDRLDRARRRRHRVAYAWEEISEYELEGFERDVGELVEAAGKYVTAVGA